MKMPDAERLWTAIPLGEDRAEAAAEIWRRYDLGAKASMRQMLNQLTAEGRIKRKLRPMPNGIGMYLYYRAAHCTVTSRPPTISDGAEGEE